MKVLLLLNGIDGDINLISFAVSIPISFEATDINDPVEINATEPFGVLAMGEIPNGADRGEPFGDE